MASATDLRRMASKLRALSIGQDDLMRASLIERADDYEADADALDQAAVNAASLATLGGL